MKFFIAAFALIVIHTSAEAQFFANAGTSEPYQTPLSPVIVSAVERIAYKVSRPPGFRMRNVGRTLTIAGVAMLIGGIVVYDNADKTYYTYQTNSGTYTEGGEEAALGVLMIMGGTGMAVPGIIFWSKGSKKYNRYMEREAAFNIKGTGLSLSYRF